LVGIVLLAFAVTVAALYQFLPAPTLYGDEYEVVPQYQDLDFEVQLPTDSVYLFNDTHALQAMLEWPSMYWSLLLPPTDPDSALAMYSEFHDCLETRVWQYCALKRQSIDTYMLV
jgi:hypothetical protein